MYVCYEGIYVCMLWYVCFGLYDMVGRYVFNECMYVMFACKVM